MTSKQSHYRFLSGFIFVYFFAQAMTISLLALWLRSTLSLSGTETGIVFSANFIAAMCSQPVYGFISDRVGTRKHILWTVSALCSVCGLFFLYVYAPLLKFNIVLGAIVGGLYLGITFIAGSYAIESYVDRISRKHGFEYSRVRLWGSLGFASAALFTGRLYNINPGINFFIASSAGVLLMTMLLLRRSGSDDEAPAAAGGGVRLAEAMALLRNPKFWRFMVFILGVTNLYLVFDQQFPSYFTSLFPDAKTGAAMFGYLNSAQIFIEAGGLFLSPLLIRRIGAKRGMMLAGGIMLARIAGSGLAVGPVSISILKMLHSIELPILVVSLFRYIACHFDNRLASTLYMVGVSFGHSLGLAILSPLVGRSYDLIGFPATYLSLAGLGLVFLLLSAWALEPTAPEHAAGKPGQDQPPPTPAPTSTSAPPSAPAPTSPPLDRAHAATTVAGSR